MTDYYLDSSALVKRYIQETGSAWISGLFDPALHNEIFIAAITPVEIIAAIIRRARRGSIVEADALAACNAFRSDLASTYQIVELTDAVITRAMSVAETHALRGYDAVQLAAALEINSLCVGSGLPSIIFVSADDGLNVVAARGGLRVENPNAHP
ncbi:MAG: type II toxin-antitoxin system VapC family toxin [Roseiflexaceae bacterium]|nr:type II toxin-antitoxin system VapC family toxin [Roseiflexaceae bacterium]